MDSFVAQKGNEYESKHAKKGRAISVLPPQEMLTRFRDMCLSSNFADFAVVGRSSKIALKEFVFNVILGYIF
jgi:hypothetical protein